MTANFGLSLFSSELKGISLYELVALITQLNPLSNKDDLSNLD